MLPHARTLAHLLADHLDHLRTCEGPPDLTGVTLLLEQAAINLADQLSTDCPWCIDAECHIHEAIGRKDPS